MTGAALHTAVVSREQREHEDALVRAHLPLVGYLVSEMIGRLPAHVSRDELTGAGMAALAFAARGFDPERGVPFNRFATARIRGALLDELRSNDWASRSVRAKARVRAAAEDQLSAQLGRTPTPEELAAFTGMGVGELTAVDEDVHRAVVLSLQGFADPTALDDLLPHRDPGAEQVLMERERTNYLHDAVAELPERLRAVVEGYFFAERPMAEIATELGVTESRVSQMRAEAMALLRDAINAQLDPGLVPAPTRPGRCVARRREAYHAAVAAHSTYRSRLLARRTTTVAGTGRGAAMSAIA